jgi:putative transposase
MPYEYHKLTPQERNEILKQRRQRGYPLHAPPYPFRESGCYLITAANYKHIPVMHSSERRTEFEILLLDVMRKIDQANMIGWVVLPNHYHLVIQLETLDQISRPLKNLHGTTSHAWNKQDQQTGKRQVWYKYSDRMIRDESHLYKAMNYIHYNPVKHGYVTDVYEWPWSSVWMYYEERGREWLRENWRLYPPGDMGDGWDD